MADALVHVSSTSPATAYSTPAEHKRRVNVLMHESLREHMHDAPIAFFCECDSPDCFKSVSLSVTEYQQRRRRDGRCSVRASSH
jgi:hypothetical protein